VVQYRENNGKTATARRGPTKCTILQISIAPKTFPSGEGGAEGDERGAAQGCDNKKTNAKTRRPAKNSRFSEKNCCNFRGPWYNKPHRNTARYTMNILTNRFNGYFTCSFGSGLLSYVD
jgi:hypothetical protein